MSNLLAEHSIVAILNASSIILSIYCIYLLIYSSFRKLPNRNWLIALHVNNIVSQIMGLCLLALAMTPGSLQSPEGMSIIVPILGALGLVYPFIVLGTNLLNISILRIFSVLFPSLSPRRVTIWYYFNIILFVLCYLPTPFPYSMLIKLNFNLSLASMLVFSFWTSVVDSIQVRRPDLDLEYGEGLTLHNIITIQGITLSFAIYKFQNSKKGQTAKQKKNVKTNLRNSILLLAGLTLFDLAAVVLIAYTIPYSKNLGDLTPEDVSSAIGLQTLSLSFCGVREDLDYLQFN